MTLKDVSGKAWASFAYGEYDQAIDVFKQAGYLGLSPEQELYVCSFFHFALGNLDKAFEGLSYRRRIIPDMFKDFPDWHERIDGDVTLVWSPPGIGVGAEIMHLGFISSLEPFAGQFIFAIDPRLVERVKKMFPWADIRSREGIFENETKFQAMTTVLSLGYISHILTGRFSRASRVIGASSKNKNKWRELITKQSSSERIYGLSWRSGRGNKPNIDLTLSHIMALASEINTAKADITYVSLQHFMGDEEVNFCKNNDIIILPAKYISGSITDFLDIIASCNQVLTVCNSVAHLSGAMSKSTQLYVSENAPWEWRPDFAERFWYTNISKHRIQP